jgi:hypothetical protein
MGTAVDSQSPDWFCPALSAVLAGILEVETDPATRSFTVCDMATRRSTRIEM